MIDVGVAEQHRIDFLRAKRKMKIAMMALGAPALKQSAVEQYRLPASVNLMHRTGNGASSGPKSNGRFSLLLASFDSLRVLYSSANRAAL